MALPARKGAGKARAKTASAYSPSHITAFFKIYPHGSTGAGVNLEEGVVTNVQAKSVNAKGKVKIKINGKSVPAPTSRAVVREFLKRAKGKWAISALHKTKLPIGYGLGVSGAGALSLALALNSALGTNLSRNLCMQIAKRAEIECGTGLGDVVAEMHAGVMLGNKPYPSRTVKKIKTNHGFAVVGFFAPIKTKGVIRSGTWKSKINKAGSWCMSRMDGEKSERAMVHCARAFSLETGLATPRLRAVMAEMPQASQAMLGETAFVLTNSPREAAKKMKKFTRRVFISRIAKRGAYTLRA
ncbi:MAG: hypothetical protein V1676_02690 [Candidatus Diapherotrites archaeon]